MKVMYSKMFVVLIICIYSRAVEAFPRKNVDQRLQPRDLGDYVSWFWSPTTKEESTTQKFTTDDEKSKQEHYESETDKDPVLESSVAKFPNLEKLEQLNESIKLFPDEIKPLQEIPDGVKAEDVDEILKELEQDMQNSENEGKIKGFNFIKSLTDTVTQATTPYVEVVYKQARHLIDIGAFGTSKRSRGLRCLFGSQDSFSGIIGLILSYLFGMNRSLWGGLQTTNNSANGANGLLSFLGMGSAPQQHQSQSQSQSQVQGNIGALGVPQGTNSFNLSGQIGGTPGVQWVSLNDLAKIRAGAAQAQPNTSDPNALLTAALLKILANGQSPGQGNSNVSLQPGTTGTSNLSMLPNGGDNSALITLIRQLTNPGQDIKIKDENSPRVVVVRVDDMKNPKSKNWKMFEIDGSPEEIYRRILRKYQSNPDLSEKIALVHELNQLKNNPDVDSELEQLIRSLENKIKRNRDYEDIFMIEEMDSKRRPNRRGNVHFINGTRDGRSGSFSNYSDDELLKELVESLMSEHKNKNIDDPDTLKRIFSGLNLRRF